MTTDDNSGTSAIGRLSANSALGEVIAACQHDLAFLEGGSDSNRQLGLLATWDAVSVAAVCLDDIGLSVEAALLLAEGKAFFRPATNYLLSLASTGLSEDHIAQFQELAGQFPVMPSDPAEADQQQIEMRGECKRIGEILCRHAERVQGLLVEGEMAACAETAAGPKRTANDRMRDKIDSDRKDEKNPLDKDHCIQWSAQRWADILGCSKGTVGGTQAWKDIIKYRKSLKTDRTPQPFAGA